MWLAVRNARLVFRWLRLSRANLFRDLRLHREVRRSAAPLDDLTRYERRAFSQNGEDGILEAIFARLGEGRRWYAEIGCGDGSECNTRRLRDRRGWHGVALDALGACREHGVEHAVVTPANVDRLLAAHGVPHDLDLLSIDIDGNDLWVWAAMSPRWRPRVVVIEYNASVGATSSVTIPYDAAHHWDRTTYFGASLQALVRVGRNRGYVLVACDSAGVNAFFVRADLAGAVVASTTVERLYRPPSYGRHLAGHPASPRPLSPYPAADTSRRVRARSRRAVDGQPSARQSSLQ